MLIPIRAIIELLGKTECFYHLSPGKNVRVSVEADWQDVEQEGDEPEDGA